MSLQVESYDGDSRQRNILDASEVEWSTHYGEDGSGYGYLRYKLTRPVGHRYPDIGFGYRQIVRKYLNTILFDGQIRQIEENSTPEGDEILVTALGHIIVATDDEVLRAYCDKRLARWRPRDEIPSGLFRPDQFGTGASALGLYTNATTQEAAADAYTDLEYEFFTGEIAERFKTELSMLLGSGTLFDGTVASISSNDVYYANQHGESRVAVGMILFNSTQNVQATITALGAGFFTVDISPASWNPGDELAVYGPLFSAQISDITGAVITYTNELGEHNLAATQMLANITQKSVATVSSNDTGADTVTVTNSDHLTGWRLNDTIIVGAALFRATIDSIATATITYSGPIGERVVSTATGWVLHNETLDDFAEVASWDIASGTVDVTNSADISGWSATEIVKIYAAYAVSIEDDAGAVLWPTADWREGAVVQNRTAIDVSTVGTPTGFALKFSCYLGGSGDETSFAAFSEVRAYSTTSDITPTFLGQEAVAALSAAGHDLSSETMEVEAIVKTIEPMVYEFKSWRDCLTEACSFGGPAYEPLAWGIRLNEYLLLFLETQPTSDDVAYVIRRTGPASISAGGDVQESVQKVRAIYNDILGEQQVTAWVEDTDAYFAGRFRTVSIRLDNVNEDAEALALAQKYLDENKNPKVVSSYEIDPGSIFTPAGYPVPFDEVQATGQYILIEDWRATNTGLASDDLWSAWATERLVGVEVNYDEGTVKLIPGSAKSNFQSYMAELSRLAQR